MNSKNSEDISICCPLVTRNTLELLSEANRILFKEPDLIEWRADFYDEIVDFKSVLKTAATLKDAAKDTPMIFTIRSEREGGEKIALTDNEVIDLNIYLCENSNIEYFDCELSHSKINIERLRGKAKENNKKIIGSYHNFSFTPDEDFLFNKLKEAQEELFDIGKIAVTANDKSDVLTLLKATLRAKEELDFPVISMAMGRYGAISRMIGGFFGSQLSFAVGDSASAPGQIPIKELREITKIMNIFVSN